MCSRQLLVADLRLRPTEDQLAHDEEGSVPRKSRMLHELCHKVENLNNCCGRTSDVKPQPM